MKIVNRFWLPIKTSNQRWTNLHVAVSFIIRKKWSFFVAYCCCVITLLLQNIISFYVFFILYDNVVECGYYI